MDFAAHRPGGHYRSRRGLKNYKKVKRSVKVVFSTNVLFLAFSTATSLVSAWALKPEGRGDLTVITMWMFISALVATLGLPYAHRYWVARQPDWNSEIFSNTIVFTLIAGVVAVLVGWQIIPLIISEQTPEVIRLTQLFLLNIPVILLSEMLRGHLEGAKIFDWLGAARISFIATQALLYLIFYAFDRLTLENALWIIIVGQLICIFLMLFAVLYKLRPRWKLSFTVFRREISYGFRSYFGIVTEFAVWRLDQMMLTALASSTVIGLYAVAVAIAEITATLASSISDALMPEVASSNNAEDASLLLGKSLRLTVYAQILALIPLWLAAPYILGWVFGAGFVEATGTLRLLLIASIVWSAALIVISGLNGFGSPGLSTVARVASAVTTVVSLAVLLPRFGMTGAAISSLFGYGVLLAVALFFLLRQRNLRLWEFLRPRRDDITLAQIKSVIRFPAAQPTKVSP